VFQRGTEDADSTAKEWITAAIIVVAAMQAITWVVMFVLA
jgi:hypothetical protein